MSDFWPHSWLVIVGVASGIWPTSRLWTLVPIIVIHTIFNLGLSAVVARIAVPFRDLNNLVPYISRLWLYVSPIILRPEFIAGIEGTKLVVFEANPLFSILSVYRGVLIGTPVEAKHWYWASGWAIGLLLVGLLSFVRYEGKMTRYL